MSDQNAWHVPGELSLKPLLLGFLAISLLDLMLYYEWSSVFARYSGLSAVQGETDKQLRGLDERIARTEQQCETLNIGVETAKAAAATAEKHASDVKRTAVSRSSFQRLDREVRQLQKMVSGGSKELAK